jgi:hypothetical protein
VDDPPARDGDVDGPARRARRSAAAATLAAISVIVAVGLVLNADEQGASGGVSPTSFIPASLSGPGGIAPEGARADARTQTAGGVRFSFDVPSQGWESFDNISINKSIVGPQGAEAIIFWTTFPDGGVAAPCEHVLRLPDDASAGDLATAMVNAPGIRDGVRLVSDLRVGGLPTQHVLLTVRARRGCDPGYFFTWRDVPQGPLWTRTTTGDTIRVWIVHVRGTLFVIEAATNEQADQQLEREITRIVGSIRFR